MKMTWKPSQLLQTVPLGTFMISKRFELLTLSFKLARISRNVIDNIYMDLQLKEQTSELLDPTWKDVRNKHLLNKMLELEQPTITVKVTNYCCKWNFYTHFAESCMCIFFVATDD